MSREVQKKREPYFDEEDFFLSYLNKKFRNAKKKLDQIEELSKKEPKTLKPEQIEKINSKADVLENIKYFEDIKDHYYAAYKASLEEGKVPSKERSGKANQGNEVSKTDKAIQDEQGEVKEASKEQVTKTTLQQVLNLLSFSQIFESSSRKEELLKNYEKYQTNNENTNIEDLQRFCHQIFNLRSEEANFNERINSSVETLFSYVESEEKAAVGDKSYKFLHETIENLLTNINQPKVEIKEKIEERVEASPIHHIEEELPKGAPILQPDFDENYTSPQKQLPKSVRFVDEIEKDMLQESPKVNETRSGEREEESLENGQRKKRYNGDYGQSKKYYEGERRPQGNRNYYGQKGEYSSYKDNKYNNDRSRNYQKGGYDNHHNQPRGNGSYQRLYVEKKQEA